VRNGWFQNESFDPREADAPGAELLGESQEAFLRDWAVDFGGETWAKIVLSQTPLANVATLPEGAASGSVIPSLPLLEPGEYPGSYKLAADCDSNGWPQTPRNRAVALMRRGLAIHLAGDQHLATLIRYGVDEFGDGGVAFTSPAISNTWPRRFFPPPESRVSPLEDSPEAPAYTGNFFDGFGNRMTVYAVANPYRTGKAPARLHDRVPGYGLVRLNRASREVTFECWPRWVGAETGFPDELQYAGWPRTFRTDDLSIFGDRLVTLRLVRAGEPVVRVVNEEGDVLYALRARPGEVVLRAPGGASGSLFVEVEDESGIDRFGPLELGADPITVR
jgi:hypothetical protein